MGLGTLSAPTTVTAAYCVATATWAAESPPRDYTFTARFSGGFEATCVVRGN